MEVRKIERKGQDLTEKSECVFVRSESGFFGAGTDGRREYVF